MTLKIIAESRCYWYDVGLGESLEAKAFRDQHTEINFQKCLGYCQGTRSIRYCPNYTIRASLIPHDEEALDRIVALDCLESDGEIWD